MTLVKHELDLRVELLFWRRRSEKGVAPRLLFDTSILWNPQQLAPLVDIVANLCPVGLLDLVDLRDWEWLVGRDHAEIHPDVAGHDALILAVTTCDRIAIFVHDVICNFICMLLLVALLDVTNGAVDDAKVILVLDVDDRMLILKHCRQLLVATSWREWRGHMRHGTGRRDV